MEKIKLPLCHLSAGQLYRACKKHHYLLLRRADGSQEAVNGMAADIAKRMIRFDENALTKFVSYSECDFSTYISYKIPFVNLIDRSDLEQL